MGPTLDARLAVVETKVGVIEDMAEDLRMVRDYVLAERAKKQLFRRVCGGVAGVAAFCGTLWEIFSAVPRK